MAKYRERAKPIDAVCWRADPTYGLYTTDKQATSGSNRSYVTTYYEGEDQWGGPVLRSIIYYYKHVKDGVDKFGVMYTKNSGPCVVKRDNSVILIVQDCFIIYSPAGNIEDTMPNGEFVAKYELM
jgi:hypothetical protein